MYDHHLIKFYILKNLDHDLVFGLPALAALNAKIDFGKTKEKLVLARNEIPIIHKVPLHTHDSISSVNSGTLDDVLQSKYETEYPNVFSKDPDSLPAAEVPPIRLELKPGSSGWRQKPYHLPLSKSNWLRGHLDKLIAQDVIAPVPPGAVIKYCSPAHLVKKPSESPGSPDDFRMVIDVRYLNLNLIFSNAYLENIQNLYNNLTGNSWYSKVDLNMLFTSAPWMNQVNS